VPARKPAPKRTFDARPDTVDFRDLMFVPTLVEVPEERPLAAFIRLTRGKPVILDQGSEGACTGFGLAAVCNHLLHTRAVYPSRVSVSARMLYEMAKRYDEWRGENYDGSSARGAMKGWHNHGVCTEKLWPHVPGKPDREFTSRRAADAADRPLGAYFRVNHKDLVAMHAAIAEVGILYASADTHSGWDKVKADGLIPYGSRILGGHAFAIVGYDQKGFWIQNSWGPDWGRRGFAHLSYEDWLDHGYDVWVARLGAPVVIDHAKSSGIKIGGLASARLSFPDIRPHVISIGNDGRLQTSGTYGNTVEDVQRIFAQDIPRITDGWKKRRILIYAHGGLVPEDNAIQRVENYLEVLKGAEVYPLAFIWRTDFWSTLKNILAEALRRRRTEGVLDATKDFMLDRLDDTLERLARIVGGRRIWNEMVENALLSSVREAGGARLVVAELARLMQSTRNVEVHLAAHSAGSIFLAPVAQLLTASGPIAPDSLRKATGYSWDPAAGIGTTVRTCTLWAPACTVGLFKAAYLPAIRAKSIESCALFNLTDAAERDDHCARIYNKSLLYLVSNAFEREPRPAFARDGWPILGMDKFVQHGRNADKELRQLIDARAIDYVTAPNANVPGTPIGSGSSAHGDFDDDGATVRATLARILGREKTTAEFRFGRSAASTGDRRRALS
jgi:hypothetical protein